MTPKRRWQIENREKYNAKRRLYRQRRKARLSQGKTCNTCGMLLVNKNYGTIVNCRDCVNRLFKHVNRAKCRAYYQKNREKILAKKKAMLQLHHETSKTQEGTSQGA